MGHGEGSWAVATGWVAATTHGAASPTPAAEMTAESVNGCWARHRWLQRRAALWSVRVAGGACRWMGTLVGLSLSWWAADTDTMHTKRGGCALPRRTTRRKRLRRHAPICPVARRLLPPCMQAQPVAVSGQDAELSAPDARLAGHCAHCRWAPRAGRRLHRRRCCVPISPSTAAASASFCLGPPHLDHDQQLCSCAHVHTHTHTNT